MPWIMTESPLAMVTVFEAVDPTGSRLMAPAGMVMSAMLMRSKHAQPVIRRDCILVMVHFQYYMFPGVARKTCCVILAWEDLFIPKSRGYPYLITEKTGHVQKKRIFPGPASLHGIPGRQNESDSL
jgi:hypothetical protein